MDWSQILNAVLIPGLIGLGGLFIWYVKYQVPKNEARKELELIAKLENHRDRREHTQASENTAIEILRTVIRESIQEHSKEVSRLSKQVENNTQSVRMMAGIISEKD